MTPALFDLPLRTGEAAALASLVLEHAEGKALNDDLRNRLASRAVALKLSSIRPYFGSLEHDPIHPSTYYLAADGLDSQPLLMHMAPAAAPSSGLFPKAILIGRMQAAGARRREIVVNVSPFAATDSARVRTFAEEVNRAFLPRPQGSRPAISVGGPAIESSLPAVFEAFRAILKSKAANVASLRLTASPETAAMWAAIRTGWREGYTLERGPIRVSDSIESVKEAIRTSPAATRFSIETSQPWEARLEINLALHDFIREIKSRRKHVRGFDFDLNLCGAGQVLTPEHMLSGLEWWKAKGRSAQLVSINRESLPRLPELAAIARQFQAIVSIDAGSGEDTEMLERAGRATNGRLDCRITPDGPDRIAEVFQRLTNAAPR